MNNTYWRIVITAGHRKNIIRVSLIEFEMNSDFQNGKFVTEVVLRSVIFDVIFKSKTQPEVARSVLKNIFEIFAITLISLNF